MHLVITLILAFCSISYELILAQSLSAIMGNTLLRYNVTIGLYLASLGAGSMVYNKGKGQSLRKRLIQVEILLTLFGSLSCFAIIFFEFTCRKFAGTLNLAMDGFFMDWFVFLGSHLMIIIIGFLSGFELPLLMDSGKEKGYSENTVLAVDYFGTLIGAVSFPLILMPNFGVIISCLLIALLNLISALFIELSAGQKSLKRIAIFAALFCALLLALVYSEKIQDWVVNNLYLA